MPAVLLVDLNRVHEQHEQHDGRQDGVHECIKHLLPKPILQLKLHGFHLESHGRDENKKQLEHRGHQYHIVSALHHRCRCCIEGDVGQQDQESDDGLCGRATYTILFERLERKGAHLISGGKQDHEPSEQHLANQLQHLSHVPTGLVRVVKETKVGNVFVGATQLDCVMHVDDSGHPNLLHTGQQETKEREGDAAHVDGKHEVHVRCKGRVAIPITGDAWVDVQHFLTIVEALTLEEEEQLRCHGRVGHEEHQQRARPRPIRPVNNGKPLHAARPELESPKHDPKQNDQGHRDQGCHQHVVHKVPRHEALPRHHPREVNVEHVQVTKQAPHPIRPSHIENRARGHDDLDETDHQLHLVHARDLAAHTFLKFRLQRLHRLSAQLRSGKVHASRASHSHADRSCGRIDSLPPGKGTCSRIVARSGGRSWSEGIVQVVHVCHRFLHLRLCFLHLCPLRIRPPRLGTFCLELIFRNQSEALGGARGSRVADAATMKRVPALLILLRSRCMRL
mmetsp:Transcript_15218/g.48559  ORF Transcript_15218/g.48559 Transcript_15218/m.48559 type:complete len:508 (-) Transcript_15218:206-1729(-)